MAIATQQPVLSQEFCASCWFIYIEEGVCWCHEYFVRIQMFGEDDVDIA